MQWVWYLELRAPDAAQQLGLWLGSLPGQPGFVSAELLVSPAQPGLALVASRWTLEPTPAAAPPPLTGAKGWVFEVARQLP